MTEPDSSPLRAYAEILRRRWAVALAAGLATLAVAAPFAAGLPDLYRAGATILVESQLPAGVIDGSPAELERRLEAVRQEARSRAWLAELIERFDLYPGMRRTGSDEDAIDRLRRDVDVDVTGTEAASGRPSTVAFRVTYVGRDPGTVAAVTNTLASFFVTRNEHLRRQQAARAAELVKLQLTETRRRLDAQAGELSAFTARHMGGLPRQLEANLATLDRLNTQLRMNGDEQLKLMDRRQSLQTQLGDLLAARPGAVDESDPEVRLARLRRQLADLQAPARNPDARRLTAEIQTLERQVAATGPRSRATDDVPGRRAVLESSLAETESQLQKLGRDSQALRDAIRTYEQRVEAAPVREPQFEALMRDYGTTRDMVDALQQRYDGMRLAERAGPGQVGGDFRILEAAVPPASPAGPNRLQVMTAGFVLALVAAIVAGLVIDRFDTSFHTVDDLRAFTRVPVLASIPRIVTPEDALVRASWRIAVAGATLMALVLAAAAAFYVARASETVTRVLLHVA